MSQAKSTTNHGTIRRWAEERDGHPAAVRGTGDADDPGLLRIDFEEARQDEDLQPIAWDEFFTTFDENDLEFLYQERTADGKISRFCKFLRKPR